MDAAAGALAARALAVVADHGVADALADGARAVDELARDIGADADVLHRLLRALALFAGRERHEEQWRALLAAGGSSRSGSRTAHRGGPGATRWFDPIRIEDGVIAAVPARRGACGSK